MNNPYRSCDARWTWLSIALGVHALIVVAALISTAMEVGMINRYLDGYTISCEEADGNDRRQFSVGMAYIASMVVVIVLFCRWIHRASSNLFALGHTTQQTSPGGAVVWWFIPIASLFKPYQVLRELLASSHRRGEVSSLLGPYWAVWLLGGWVGTAAGRIFLSGDDGSIEDLLTGDYVAMASDGLLLVAAALVFYITRQVTRDQDAKNRRQEDA